MLLYPEVQQQAKEQIDSLVGSSRLPTMDDENELPYVRCLIKETLSKSNPCAVSSVLMKN